MRSKQCEGDITCSSRAQRWFLCILLCGCKVVCIQAVPLLCCVLSRWHSGSCARNGSTWAMVFRLRASSHAGASLPTCKRLQHYAAGLCCCLGRDRLQHKDTAIQAVHSLYGCVLVLLWRVVLLCTSLVTWPVCCDWQGLGRVVSWIRLVGRCVVFVCKCHYAGSSGFLACALHNVLHMWWMDLLVWSTRCL